MRGELWIAWIVVIPMLLSACSASLVQQASKSFHDGTTSSAATLETSRAAAISFERARLSWPAFGAAHTAARAKSGLVVGFANYLCARPSGPDAMISAFNPVTQAAAIADPDTITPGKTFAAKLAGIKSALETTPSLKSSTDEDGVPGEPNGTDTCNKIVREFLQLAPNDLPSLEITSKKTVFAPLAAAAALFGLAQTIYTGGDLALGYLQQEAQAKEILRFIRNDDTQRKVLVAFATIEAPYEVKSPGTRTDTFCSNRPLLCQPSVVFAPAKSVAKEGAATSTPSGVSERTCPARPNWTYPQPPEGKTIFDAITIDQRWSELQIAWYRYVDFVSAPGATNQIRLERLAALNQAVTDYLAVPSAPDVVRNVGRAWSRLTDLAYGCISSAEAWGALEQFAKQAGDVLSAAKKVSDARDTFDKSLLSASTPH